MCEFHDSYRSVTDRNGVTVTLTLVQAAICEILDQSRFPRPDGAVVDLLEDRGFRTQTIRHAFRAGEGRRLWGRLIKRKTGARGFLYLDRDSDAGPPLPRRRTQPRPPRDPSAACGRVKGAPEVPADVLAIAQNLQTGRGRSDDRRRR